MSEETSTSWVNCPEDILMEITSHLALGDSVAFLSVCSAFKKLMDSQSLWIHLLKRVEQRRPLACPVGTNFQDLGIDKLREIIQHTSRLEANWGSCAPLILGAVKSTNWSLQQAEILHIVPGTSLAIIYTPENTRRITCCNLENLGPPVFFHVGLITHAAHYDKLGCHLMALVRTRKRGEEAVCSLLVLRLKYGNETNTIIEKIFNVPLQNPGNGLFIHEDVVGVIAFPAGGSFINISTTNFITQTTASMKISVGYPINASSRLCSYMRDRTLSIVVAHGSEYDIFDCPTNEFPFSITHSSQLGGERTLEGDAIRAGRIDDQEAHLSDLEVAMLNQCPLGLYTIIQFEYRGRFAALFRFWPVGNHGPLETLRLSGTIRSPWKDDKMRLIASSPSGTHVAFILDQTPRLERCDPILRLYLVVFTTDPDKICAHQPEVPDYINLEDVHSIGVDERCGVIYLLSKEGDVFAIPYA